MHSDFPTWQYGSRLPSDVRERVIQGCAAIANVFPTTFSSSIMLTKLASLDDSSFYSYDERPIFEKEMDR